MVGNDYDNDNYDSFVTDGIISTLLVYPAKCDRVRTASYKCNLQMTLRTILVLHRVLL